MNTKRYYKNKYLKRHSRPERIRQRSSRFYNSVPSFPPIQFIPAGAFAIATNKKMTRPMVSQTSPYNDAYILSH